MDVKQIRHRHLLDLIKKFGSNRKFADATETSVGHVSQMKNGTRQVGDDVARRIETTLGKPHGWIDRLELDSTPPDDPARVVKDDQRTLLELWRFLSPAQVNVELARLRATVDGNLAVAKHLQGKSLDHPVDTVVEKSLGPTPSGSPTPKPKAPAPAHGRRRK